MTEKPTEDIRFVGTKLRDSYKKGKERHQMAHLQDLFPCSTEVQTMDECVQFEGNTSNTNENDVPLRYPKLQEDSSEFYTQFTHHYSSILKKRPYESNESSNEGMSMKIDMRERIPLDCLFRSITQTNVDQSTEFNQSEISSKNQSFFSLSFSS